jgi:hypothetical protein
LANGQVVLYQKAWSQKISKKWAEEEKFSKKWFAPQRSISNN